MANRLLRISVEQGAPDEAVMEAARRMNYDGIPRTVYADGKIMKWDWEVSEQDQEEWLSGEEFKDHVTRLLQYGEQG